MGAAVRVAGLVAASTLLAGCGFLPIPLPTVIVDQPTSSPSSTPSSAEASPVGSDDWDVSAFELSGFASPNGSTICAIGVDGARCDLPDDFTGSTSGEDGFCPDSDVTATGVQVTDDPEWICGGDRSSAPAPGTDQTAWWKHTGFPTVKRGGSTWVTLPVGKKLLAGDYFCLSTAEGITCGNVLSGAGFSLTRAAATLF